MSEVQQGEPDEGREINEQVEEAYAFILDRTNRLLHLAKNYHIDALKLEDNPTVEEVASRMEEMMVLLEAVRNSINGFTIDKAHEYTTVVRAVAAAVRDGDAKKLAECIETLNRSSFL
jgi:hypothetical protein